VPGTLERREWSGDKNATKHTPDGKMPGESHCSPREIQKYLNRVSGPMLDRIDLHIEVPAVKFQEITSQRNGEPSATIRERVIAARHVQQHRFKHRPRITCASVVALGVCFA
jgi:magnesium chelatase family protein